MSLDFRGGVAETTPANRRERSRYKQYMDILKASFSVKDTLYNEKHYGFLNKKHQTVQHISGIDTISFGQYAPEVYGLNFVVDQFNAFRDFYLNFTSESGLSAPSIISGLVPGRSFENFDEAYQNHINRFSLLVSAKIDELVQNSRLSGRGMMLPLQFYNHFSKNILFLQENEGFHISKSGFAISTKSKVYQTGLYVDLADQVPTSIDVAKGEMLEDPGFLCYLTFATEYGFSIDFNAPWRLIIDLKHEKTVENILNGRKNQDYWNFYYDQYVENTGFSYDYNNIRDFYETLYKMYYKMYNSISSLRANQLDWSTIYRNLLNESLSSTKYGPGQFWVEVFVLNRLREVGKIVSYQEFESDREVSNIRQRALLIYGSELNNPAGIPIENSVTTGRIGQTETGVAAYVTTVCGEILKERF